MLKHPNELDAGVQGLLYALGIPPHKHDVQGLAEYFPTEFDIGAVGLDAETLANVLIHLVKQGVVTIPAPRSGGRSEVRPGRHVCQFYRGADQLFEVVTPYLADGLQRGEKCIWVLPAPMTADAARAVLAGAVGDVAGQLASGQLELLPHQSWYLNHLGKLKPWEVILDAWLAKQDEALARGFTSLRVTGDTGWIVGEAERAGFIEYETKVNGAIENTKIAALCTYRAEGTARDLAAVVAAHQEALYGDAGAWRPVAAQRAGAAFHGE